MKVRFYINTVFFLLTNLLYSQVSADCSNPIHICSTTSSGGNVNGLGNDDFNGHSASGCLGNGGGGVSTVESNSAWYTFSFTAGGQFGFTIDPNINTEDWDFALYGPFSSVTGNCGAIANASSTNGIASCNYSGSTVGNGNTGVGINPVTGSQTTPYQPWLNVSAGQTYMLLINNYSATNHGFTLSFQGSIFNAHPDALNCDVECPLTIGPDIQLCPGQTTTLTASISGATSYSWSSSIAGPILGNTQSINVSTEGIYTVSVIKPGCIINPASIQITNYVTPSLNFSPPQINICSPQSTFNLTSNNSNVLNGLNPSDFEITYHLTSSDAMSNANPITNPTNYTAPNNTTIYLSVVDINGANCTNVVPMTLIINPLSDAVVSGTATVNLNSSSPSVTFTGSGGVAPYTFTYNINGGTSQQITTTTGNS
ncbi:adhesin, partial [Flavobacterium branchiophilum]